MLIPVSQQILSGIISSEELSFSEFPGADDVLSAGNGRRIVIDKKTTGLFKGTKPFFGFIIPRTPFKFKNVFSLWHFVYPVEKLFEIIYEYLPHMFLLIFELSM